MKIKNGDLNGLVTFLYKMELTGKESRMRARIITFLGEKYAIYERERNEIILTYAKRDEQGNFIVISGDNGLNYYDSDNLAAFQKELNDLALEELVIDETEERQMMLTTVRDVLLEYSEPMKSDEAITHDRYCSIFEELKY